MVVWIKEPLKSMVENKDMGKTSFILCIKIKGDKKCRKLFLSQELYLKSVWKYFDVVKRKVMDFLVFKGITLSKKWLHHVMSKNWKCNLNLVPKLWVDWCTSRYSFFVIWALSRVYNIGERWNTSQVMYWVLMILKSSFRTMSWRLLVIVMEIEIIVNQP